MTKKAKLGITTEYATLADTDPGSLEGRVRSWTQAAEDNNAEDAGQQHEGDPEAWATVHNTVYL